MIPGPSRPGARPPFPYIGIATAILMLHAILVAIFPPNPYRAALALVALFSMGYCALSLIVGREIRLSAPEILAFSTGLTIFITSLSALGVSILGIPITVFAVVIVGLPISIFAWLVQRPRGNPLGPSPISRASSLTCPTTRGSRKGLQPCSSRESSRPS